MKLALIAGILILGALAFLYFFWFNQETNNSFKTTTTSSTAATEVINFKPQIPNEAKSGSCFTNSISVNSPNAWRCTVGNEIYDPCLYAADNKTLVCNMNPATGEKGFVLNLTEPLPSPEPTMGTDANTWLVELPNSKTCGFATGATGLIDNERINYFCENADQKVTIALYGDLKRGKTWTANLAEFTQNDFKDGQITPGKKEVTPLQKVWIYE